MKLFKSILFAILTIGSLQTASASSDPMTTAATEIRDMLKSSLENQQFDNNTKIFITFILNENNEVLVLSTNDNSLDRVIKNTLNYKVLENLDLENGKKYTLPVTLIK